MKVSDFIERLKALPQDLDIIAGSDDEGNDYINPYAPGLSWCVKSDTTTCGWRPIHHEDKEEYESEGYELIQMVVM